MLFKKQFGPLFGVQFLQIFNDYLFKTTLLVYLTYQHHYSTKETALLGLTTIAIFMLPFFLWSARAGTIGDHQSKPKLIRYIKWFELGIMLLATFAFYKASAIILLITLFLLGAHSTFFIPLKFSLLSEQIPKKKLLSANALVEISNFFAIFMASILGSTIATLYQNHPQYHLSQLNILIALFGLILSYCIPKTSPSHTKITAPSKRARRIGNHQLLRYINRHRIVALAITGISWFWFSYELMMSQLPIITKLFFHAQASMVSQLFALFAIGSALGNGLCLYLLNHSNHTRYVWRGCLVSAICLADLYHLTANHAAHIMPSTPWHLYGNLALFAASNSFYVLPLYTLLQNIIIEKQRARLFAANNLHNACYTVTASLIGLLLIYGGMRLSHLFLMAALATGIITLFLRRLPKLHHPLTKGEAPIQIALID